MDYLDKNMMIEKKKMINSLEKEIDRLQDKKNNIEIANFKIRILRQIKMALCAGRRVFPYALVTGLLFGVFASVDSTPIFRDESKKYLSTRKTYDSNGNYGSESQYEKYNRSIDTFTFYDKWSLVDDGLYSRNVRVYDISKIDESAVLEALDNIELFDVDKALGKPISNINEKKNNVSLENNTAFGQVIIYDEDRKDYVYSKETISQNALTTVAWACLSFVISFVPLEIREKHSNFDYRDRINDIKANNPYLDSNELDRKIKIKKANYDRLVNDNV